MKKELFIKKNNISDQEFELISNYVMIRTDNKISQRKLSELTGLAQSTVARVEKNIQSASITTFIKLVDALGYHVELVKNKK